MNNKEIEQIGLNVLKDHLKKEFGKNNIEWEFEDRAKELGVDLVIKVGETEYLLELKASRRHPYKDNLRDCK